MVKVIAPTNIAIVKYWGKHPKYEQYHIPMKSSLSFTVEGLYTETEVKVEKGNFSVEFELNGKKIEKGEPERKYIDGFFEKLGKHFPFVKDYAYTIASKNNFPTAAGFASSASGFAALAKALIYSLDEFEEIRGDEKKESAIARLGSGSATRSMPSKGGVVIWHRGFESENEEIKDPLFASYAESIFDPEHWKDLRIIYAKVESREKKIKSRAGMKKTLQTSFLYKKWVEYDENILLKKTIESIEKGDFEMFADCVIEGFTGLHAVMLNTKPPIIYLNEKSKEIINTIEEANKEEKKATYTFDAGPNAIVFTLQKYEGEITSLLQEMVGKENLFVTKPGRGTRVVEQT